MTLFSCDVIFPFYVQFFFKATLLQNVNELLLNIRVQLDAASAILDELVSLIRPIENELKDLQDKIKNMEHVEEIANEVQNLKKKLAWSWVFDVDRQIQEQNVKLEKLKERVPTCQERIDKYLVIALTCTYVSFLLYYLIVSSAEPQLLGHNFLLMQVSCFLLVQFSVFFMGTRNLV